MLSPFDAKLISIFIISASTYFIGILPAAIGLGSRFQRSLILSAVLCFGGGVLLATSLVHILPEARIVLSKWAEVVYCAGFFTIYLMDVILQTCYSLRGCSEEDQPLLNDPGPSSYSSIPENTQQKETKHYKAVESRESINQWTVSNYGLLVAFSVHSLLEGLVIGVQTTSLRVLLLLGAVSCHKLVVTFCLGSELSSAGQPVFAVIPLISIYVVGSAVGIAIGMYLEDGFDPAKNVTVPVLQALAGGTLLYIVLSEILPRERLRELPSNGSSAVQFISLMLGFVLMVSLTMCL